MDIAELRLHECLDAVASTRVAPSGGAVAALTGAFGAALGEMGCTHTIAKHSADAGDGDLTELGTELRTRRTHLVELAEADATAVDELRAAFDDHNGDQRVEEIEAAWKLATESPLEIAEECLVILEAMKVVTANATENVTPDVGVGARFVYAAIQTSVWLVRLNVDQVEEQPFRSEAETRTEDVSDAAQAIFTEIAATLGDPFDVTAS